MPPERKRRRPTIALLMALVALVAMLLALGLPVLRQGPPPCLTAAGTARWLAERPLMANCSDCHAQVSLADRLRVLAPPPANPLASCPPGRSLGPNSCVSCHAKP